MYTVVRVMIFFFCTQAFWLLIMACNQYLINILIIQIVRFVVKQLLINYRYGFFYRKLYFYEYLLRLWTTISRQQMTIISIMKNKIPIL